MAGELLFSPVTNAFRVVGEDASFKHTEIEGYSSIEMMTDKSGDSFVSS
jgi:hypothetical protein